MNGVFTELFVEVDGRARRYLQAGTGEPLVFVGDGGEPHLSKSHELLAGQYRVICFDLPDRGAGEPAGSHAATLLAALRAIGVGRFSAWGAGTGGAVAMCTAIAAPDLVAALVLESPRADMHAQLADINTPALVVFGTRDAVIPPETGRIYREKMPNCNYVLVFDAGHQVAADRPEAFTSLVGDFLERREAFIVSQKSSLLHP